MEQIWLIKPIMNLDAEVYPVAYKFQKKFTKDIKSNANSEPVVMMKLQ